VDTGAADPPDGLGDGEEGRDHLGRFARSVVACTGATEQDPGRQDDNDPAASEQACVENGYHFRSRLYLMSRPRSHEVALIDAGLKVTKQRLAVMRALDGRSEAVSAQDLHHELWKRQGSPGLATIYRTLASLADGGVLDTFTHEGEQRFRMCGSKHHHHLVCRGCGTVEEVASDAIESWVDAIARRRGFEVTGHSAEVYGYCATCR
jgi:Fur family ferric uptake transcriptional regulator